MRISATAYRFPRLRYLSDNFILVNNVSPGLIGTPKVNSWPGLIAPGILHQLSGGKLAKATGTKNVGGAMRPLKCDRSATFLSQYIGLKSSVPSTYNLIRSSVTTNGSVSYSSPTTNSSQLRCFFSLKKKFFSNRLGNFSPMMETP